MAQKDRLFEILDMVRAQKKVSVTELSRKYQVTGETIRRRTGSLQGTSSDGSPAGQLPAERAGQLQLVAEHLSSRWQSGIWTIDRKGRVLAWTLRSRFGQMQTGFENMMPKLADGWNNLLDSLRIGNIWKWVTGLFSPA